MVVRKYVISIKEGELCYIIVLLRELSQNLVINPKASFVPDDDYELLCGVKYLCVI